MDEHRGVRLPPELHAVPPRPVEVRFQLAGVLNPDAQYSAPEKSLEMT